MARQTAVVLSVITTALLLVLLTTFMGACAKRHSYGNAASVSSAPAPGYVGDMALPAESGVGEDSQYSSAKRSAGMYGENAPPPLPGSKGGVGPEFKPEAYAKEQFKLDRWFSPAAYAADTKPDEQYLIRNGDIALQIESYDKAAQAVSDVAAKYGGVVTDSNMEKAYDGTRSGFVTLRVPSAKFFEAWADLLALGEVTHQNSTAQDVSQQYVAAVSRLKNLTTEQATLQGMLADAREVQRTRGLGEAYKVLLDTQARLSEVTGELQATEDQVSQLADQITRSTIKVNLAEKAVYKSEEFTWGFGDTFKAAGKAVVLGFKGFINWLIFFAVTTAWWLALIIWWLRVMWLRWRKKRQAVTLKS